MQFSPLKSKDETPPHLFCKTSGFCFQTFHPPWYITVCIYMRAEYRCSLLNIAFTAIKACHLVRTHKICGLWGVFWSTNKISVKLTKMRLESMLDVTTRRLVSTHKVLSDQLERITWLRLSRVLSLPKLHALVELYLWFFSNSYSGFSLRCSSFLLNMTTFFASHFLK